MIPIEVVESTGRKSDPFVRKENIDLCYIEQAVGFQTVVRGIINKEPLELDNNL